MSYVSLYVYAYSDQTIIVLLSARHEDYFVKLWYEKAHYNFIYLTTAKDRNLAVMVNWLEDWERSPSQLMSTAYLSKDFITDSIGSLRVGFYHETTLTADVKIWHSVSSWCRILIRNDWTVLCSSQKDAFNYSLCHLEVLLFSKNPCHKLPVSKPSSSPKKWVCNEVKIQFLNSVCLQIFDYNIQGMWLCRLFSCWNPGGSGHQKIILTTMPNCSDSTSSSYSPFSSASAFSSFCSGRFFIRF